MLLDGRDVSQRIRESDVTLAASRVSMHPPVREIMVSRQREMGASGGVVMEGRDIGTAVFPNADVKVFLDADARVRAERRVAQNGTLTPEEAQRTIEDLVARDQRDRTRAVSPLVPAPDAVIIDSTNLRSTMWSPASNSWQQRLRRSNRLCASSARRQSVESNDCLWLSF